MPNDIIDAYELSAGVFVRGLTNLKTQLTKAEHHASSGEAALLDARLAPEERSGVHAPADLHMYTLAAQVHWAAEGAMLAIAQLLDKPRTPTPNDAGSFADLHQRLDEAIAYLKQISADDLQEGLDRTIKHPRGSTQTSGAKFLVAFAIPHFFYHLTTVYGILRNKGVQLTMGDFLGNWAAS